MGPGRVHNVPGTASAYTRSVTLKLVGRFVYNTGLVASAPPRARSGHRQQGLGCIEVFDPGGCGGFAIPA